MDFGIVKIILITIGMHLAYSASDISLGGKVTIDSLFYQRFAELHQRFAQKWHTDAFKPVAPKPATEQQQATTGITDTVDVSSGTPETTIPKQTITDIAPPPAPYIAEVADTPTPPPTSDIVITATDTPDVAIETAPEPATAPQSNTVTFEHTASLRDSEIATLKALGAIDSDAKDWFAELKKVADNALDDTISPPAELVSSGEASKTGATANTSATNKESDKVFKLALWYRLSGDSKYLDKTRDYLTAWAGTNNPSGDAVESTTLVNMFKAYDLVKDSLSASDKSRIESWMKGIADKNIETYNQAVKDGSQVAFNNHQSHRIRVVGAIGLALGNEALVNFMVDGFKGQIEKDLNPDGSSYDFIRRDAMHYHCYNLEALLDTARMIDRASAMVDEAGKAIDPFTYEASSGASLKKSVEFMLPYATGDKTHIDYVNSKEKVDAARGLEAVPFNPKKDSVDVIAITSYFTDTLKPDGSDKDVNLVQLVDTLKGKSADKKYPTLDILLDSTL